MKLDVNKIAVNLAYLIPAAMLFYAWIALLHIGIGILGPVEQSETTHGLILMAGSGFFGALGNVWLSLWLYHRACSKAEQKTVR